MANQGSYPSSQLPGMPTLKNEVIEDSVFPASPKIAVSQELEFWQTFAFDMDRDPRPNSRNPRNPQRSRSTSTSNTTGQQPQLQSTSGPNLEEAALLAQFAAATGGGDLSQAYSNLMSQAYPSMNPTPGFYGSFLHHNMMQPPQQLPPLSSLDFPWHGLPQQPQASASHYSQNPSTGMSSLPYLDTQFNSTTGPRSPESSKEGRRRNQSTSAVNEGRSTSSPEVEMTETERLAIADEKRRRNTAASGKRTQVTLGERHNSRDATIPARFRVKKKHKTIGLERSVSDLSGRAEELEREAADLRRENGWLKEIVMLKGTRFAASNLAHREALTQAAVLATGGFTNSTMGEPSGSGAGPSRTDEKSESESSESESSESEGKKSKKKGKSKQVPTRKK